MVAPIIQPLILLPTQIPPHLGLSIQGESWVGVLAGVVRRTDNLRNFTGLGLGFQERFDGFQKCDVESIRCAQTPLGDRDKTLVFPEPSLPIPEPHSVERTLNQKP